MRPAPLFSASGGLPLFDDVCSCCPRQEIVALSCAATELPVTRKQFIPNIIAPRPSHGMRILPILPGLCRRTRRVRNSEVLMKTFVFLGLIALISAGTSGCWWGWRHHDEGSRG